MKKLLICGFVLIFIGIGVQIAIKVNTHRRTVTITKQSAEAASAVNSVANSKSPTPPQLTNGKPSGENRISPDQVAKFANAYRSPITFYGRVIDQLGKPVEGATAKMIVANKAFQRGSEFIRQSDGSGLFQIAGVRGLSLAVAVSKEGFRDYPPVDSSVSSSGVFNYGIDGFTSNAETPVVFHLYRVGLTEPLIRTGPKKILLSRDGTPVKADLDGHGGHNCIIRCWNSDLQRPAGQQQFDWSFEIEAEAGNLIRRSSTFDTQAPIDGYISDDLIEMPASLPSSRWDMAADRSYFIKFDDGRYGRVDLRVKAFNKHFVLWESYFNPQIGSRNLEFDSSNSSARSP